MSAPAGGVEPRPADRAGRRAPAAAAVALAATLLSALLPGVAGDAQATGPAAAGPANAYRCLLIQDPAIGSPVASQFVVRGSGTVTPFESTLAYRVYDPAGQVVGQGALTVRGQLGQPFTFEAPVRYGPTRGGRGWLELLEANAAGGPPLVSVAIALSLRPSLPLEPVPVELVVPDGGADADPGVVQAPPDQLERRLTADRILRRRFAAADVQEP